MNFRFALLGVLLLTVATSGAQPTPPSASSDCLQRRAVIGIGSASTRLRVADVNRCTHTVVRVLATELRRVSYAASLRIEANHGAFPDAIQNEGIAKILELKAIANQLNPAPTQFLATATQAFRTATNAAAVTARITAETAIPVQVILQDEEAILGFEAALTQSPVPRGQAVVWDIGGGSVQITTLDNQGDYLVYRSTYASERMQAVVSEHILNRTGDQLRNSPNPLSYTQLFQGANLAWTEALRTIPLLIERKIRRFRNNVIGIGGVFYDSLRCLTRPAGTPPTHERCVTPNPVHVTAAEWGQTMSMVDGWSDEQIVSWLPAQRDYVRTTLTNLSLVDGFSRALGLTQITVVAGGLEQGALVRESLWSAIPSAAQTNP